MLRRARVRRTKPARQQARKRTGRRPQAASPGLSPARPKSTDKPAPPGNVACASLAFGQNRRACRRRRTRQDWLSQPTVCAFANLKTPCLCPQPEGATGVAKRVHPLIGGGSRWSPAFRRRRGSPRTEAPPAKAGTPTPARPFQMAVRSNGFKIRERSLVYRWGLQSQTLWRNHDETNNSLAGPVDRFSGIGNLFNHRRSR